MDDVVAVEQMVRRTVRPDPARVFIVRVSEGELVATLAVERESGRYEGALAACGPIAPPAQLVQGWESTYAAAAAAAITADPGRGAELAAVTGVPAEGLDAAMLVDAVVSLRLGGQPYDNSDRAYTGSSDDPALNAGVARFAPDLAARAALARFETSGEPSAPISIIHTTGDPSDVERVGYCAFTSTEILAAFADIPR